MRRLPPASRRLSLLGALVALLAAPPAAHAVTILEAGRPSIAQRQQAWADASLVATPRVVVRLHRSSCPGRPEPACALARDVWLSSTLGSRRLERSLLLHELGHVFDAAMPGWARLRFERLASDRRPWRSPRNSPHERFAVAYDLCARGERVEGGTEYGYGYSPRPRTHRRVCAMIRRVGRSDPSVFEASGPQDRDFLIDLLR